nr:PREDICTED: immunoglobulin superfamily member 1-like [Struthio camelus australis]XP_009673260.1 PREDICTED: immunoglobulin superfamily member 1-like [Struthio camelus australis]
MVPVLVFGWWLVVQSRVQAQPGLSLSLSPSHEVALGDRVTLQCHTPRRGGRATLHKERVPHPLWYQDGVWGAVEFPIPAARRKDAGRYWCQYEIEGEPPEESEPVELVLRDPKYPRPRIFLSSGSLVALGTHVTILCQGGHGATFFLHREGSSAPIQRQAPGGHMALFSIPDMSWADSGAYSCSYRPRGEMFMSSYPSTFLELEVEEKEEESGSAFLPASPDAMPAWSAWSVPPQGSPRPNTMVPHPSATGSSCPSTSRDEDPDFTLGNTVRLGLGAGLLILLTFLVAEALCSRRRKGL